jgi:hypothetical protein
MSSTGPPVVCKRGKPLTTGNIKVYRLGPGGKFDLAGWQGTGGIAYRIDVRVGVLQSSRRSNY